MKPQTIKNIFSVGMLAGLATLFGSNLINGRPAPNPSVARIQSIEQLMTQPDFSLREISYFESSDLDKFKNKYNTLSREKDSLIFAGVENEMRAYESNVVVRAKRWKTQATTGTVMIIAGGLGLLWYKPRKREDENTSS